MSISLRVAATVLLVNAAMSAGALAQPVIESPPDDILNGTVLPSGATVNVGPGGFVGLAVDLSNGDLNISGGEVAIGASGISTGFTNSNNTVNISGGNIGPFFQFFNSDGVVSGGTLETFGVFSGSTVTVTGGTITGFPDVFSNGTVNISGGNVESFRALTGSTVNITGTAFRLNGAPVQGLTPDTQRLVTERNVTLNATLEDGSEFEVFLRPFDPGFPTPDVALPSATITLTLVEQFCAGDCDDSRTVDFNDLVAMLFDFGIADGGSACDADDSGEIDFNDLVSALFLFGPCD